jgi:hypothetical protein
MERREIARGPCHLGVPSVMPKMISEPMVLSMQILHLSCVKVSTISKWTELSLEPCQQGAPSGASKTISKPMICLAQTVHLSYIDTNTVSKWKEVRFHMTHVTREFHRVCPKWFLSLWYVQRKPCTYLASRLALSPKGPKRASTWASSPSGTIRCIQNNFWAYGTSSANHAPILHRH